MHAAQRFECMSEQIACAARGVIPLSFPSMNPDSPCWLPPACCVYLLLLLSAPLPRSPGAKVCLSTPGCST
jgi:hypothetical protein